jgi:hypothetical protein
MSSTTYPAITWTATHAEVSTVTRSADHLDVFLTDVNGRVLSAAWQPDFADW